MNARTVTITTVYVVGSYVNPDAPISIGEERPDHDVPGSRSVGFKPLQKISETVVHAGVETPIRVREFQDKNGRTTGYWASAAPAPDSDSAVSAEDISAALAQNRELKAAVAADVSQ